MTEQELLNQNNETFRDEGSDAHKLKGKTRAFEARGFFANIITSVWAALSGKSNVGHGHTIDEVDNLKTTLNSHNQRITDNTNALADLEGGTTINSTDDIANEGAVNKWFTDARVYLAKATNYVIQGTTRAITQNDTLGMILGIFENRLNLIATAITNLTNSLGSYVQKPDERTIANTGSVAITMDRDAFLKMTDGQIAGNLTLNLSGGVRGVEQVLNFKGNGVATSVSIPGATKQGGKSFVPTLGADNELWIRVGQSETGAIKYYYLWA